MLVAASLNLQPPFQLPKLRPFQMSDFKEQELRVQGRAIDVCFRNLFEVARALRRNALLNGVPIIAVTSYAMAGDREKAMAAGCDGYIEKPIDPETFVSELEKLFLREPT
jgi:CheY-like chemotaxis protein